jgi:hypothetical protein
MRLRGFGWGLTGSVLLVLAFCACGTPGAPLPPSLNLAVPVDDLTASRRGYKVDLEWTLPHKNTDRTLIKHNPVTRICRREGLTLMAKCDVIAEVEPPTANARGRSAGLSNQVPIPLVPVIAAPDKLSAEVSADGVRISWSGPVPPQPPPGVTYRYRMMRRAVGAPAYIVLDDVAPSAKGSYLDKTFGWEQKYEYRITTLGEARAEGTTGAVEGEDSPSVEVFARDIYPPAQPVGLQAVFSSVGQKPFIDLTWAPNSESDLAGYNVFRWTNGEQPKKLNQQLIQTPSYRDDNVEAGKRYSYAVSAVDLRSNESPHSATASETVPNK